ncbi:Domain of unknown function DUF148 domain-containing protein [Strongyloides ratti]|uniref:DUF148 domain-containing protein n=1 Tax=Strongyloides ratti TaxID=34506 RepID=A0A090MW28_STRRB|nr:Domain of unknown function DUF148 domain-containing protein [Strongyloides ratti]CEF63353.1 Domain of unknown function DUF148 domain-containing protein [Strongyloides ratti]
MKYFSLIIIAAFALSCNAGYDYYKLSSPLYMSLTRTQIGQIKLIQSDDTLTPSAMRQKILDYLTTQGNNFVTLYNQFVANQTSLINEVKQTRLQLINNSTMSESAKNAQIQIDEISSNENLSKFDKKNQIRQIKANLPLSVINEIKNFENGRMNPSNSRYLLETTNNRLTYSQNSDESLFDFDFEDAYEIDKRSVKTPISRARRAIQ